MTWAPGWAIDPALPRLPEHGPRCDACQRTLTDIAAGNGRRLPNRHRGPATARYGAPCPRTKDDLLGVVLLGQYRAAGLPIPRRMETT